MGGSRLSRRRYSCAEATPRDEDEIGRRQNEPSRASILQVELSDRSERYTEGLIQRVTIKEPSSFFIARGPNPTADKLTLTSSFSGCSSDRYQRVLAPLKVTVE